MLRKIQMTSLFLGGLLVVSSAFASVDDFDPACYLRSNPDVARNWRGKPSDHWLQYGQFEINADGSSSRNPGCNPDPSAIFNGTCYLRNNPDVAASSFRGNPYRHYIMYGQFEARRPGCSALTPYSGNNPYAFSPGNYPDTLQIASQSDEAGKRILIKASPIKFAGAIYSLIYDGLEFIDATDHGRELQSASSFDNGGECFNPTEAGSGADYQKNSSTSVLLSADMTSSKMSTHSQTAFWLYGAQKSGACVSGGNLTQVPLSPQHLKKTVSMNYKGDPSVVEYLVEFMNPKGMIKSSGAYEIITGYLTGSVSQLWTVDPANNSVVFQNGYQSLSTSLGFPNNTFLSNRADKHVPIMVSTADGKHAMGVLMPRDGQLQIGRPNSSFNGTEFFHFTNLNKWSLSYWDGNPDQADLKFRVLIVVGDKSTVSRKLYALARSEGYW